MMQSVESRATAESCKEPTPRKRGSRVRLNTADDVRVEMARLYREMRSDQLDPAKGSKLCYVLGQVGKQIETSDLEKRIERLEREGKL